MFQWASRLFERKSLAEPSDDLLRLFGIADTAAGISVTAETALRVPAVAAAVRLISEAAASLDIRVVEIAPDGTETVLPDHPVAALLTDEANAWTSGFELVRSLVVDALTRDAGGLAWVNWVNGRPIEIIKYRAGVIQRDDMLDTGEPVYKIGATVVPSQQIINVRGPFGRCPLSLAREAIAVAAIMEKHAGALFNKGARPSGVLTTEQKLGEQAIENVVKVFEKQHAGANSGRTMLLPGGWKFSSMTLNSVDAQFAELRLFQLQEVARAFGIPAPMLGDLSRATWSNTEQKAREFLSYCLEPWLRALEGALRRALFLPEDRKRFAIRFDRDDLTRADLQTRATAINSLISSRTINPNEGRDWLGLPPRAGGEEYANPNTGSSQPGGA